jgi:glc operon protein GlcG
MRKIQLIAAALVVGGLVSPAAAQVAAHKSLTIEGAKNVIAAAVTYARTKAGTGVIAVVDDGGNLMALERLDGTFAAGANISIGKARTAALFKKPTRVFEELINKGRTAMTAVNDFTPLIGGVPILVDGQIVGAIGVSGAASAQEDEEVAMAGAAGIGTQVSSVAPLHMMNVSYFPHDQVNAAFAKGSVLLDGTGRNYMVHASRREKAGQVEVHVLDTDVIYVQDGSATLVTGGAVVGGKTIEPNEIRGDSITSGETRRIAKGDVITVPNGTPHWFQDVKGTLTYYVVKVR